MNACIIIRHNTELDGDIRLAVREFESLSSCQGIMLSSQGELNSVVRHHAVSKALLPRTAVVAVKFAAINAANVASIVERSAFSQEVFAWGTVSEMLELQTKLRCPSVCLSSKLDNIIVCLSQMYLLESEGVFDEAVRRQAGSQDELLDTVGANRLQRVAHLLLSPFTSSRESVAARTLRKAKKTTLHLSHDLHIYKAKFFPRMVRALLNIFGDPQATVLDPYCGSGTALLEASLLGMKPYGCDVDPICATISEAKILPFLQPDECLRILQSFEKRLLTTADANESTRHRFPAELAKKLQFRDRREGTHYQDEILSEASRIADVIAHLPAQARSPLIGTLASDAVTKKIRFRFVGVGNGRYTIEILKQSILSRLTEKAERSRELVYTFSDLSAVCGTVLVEPTVGQGDARELSSWPIRKNVDVIITSPPYLPASSGREHYGSSRALSFYVLGIDGQGYDHYEPKSADEDAKFDIFDCPEATRLMDYLCSDEHVDADPQRDAMRFKRKAIPTLIYLRDIELFFKNANIALSGDGVLIFVVASQHVFYSHRRNEIEHTVSCRRLYGELASRAGLSLTEELPLELKKSAASRAKPRAKDKYSESILIFRRTVG